MQSGKSPGEEQKKAKEIVNIQQLKFAGGHPPNYYAAGRVLKYARADGMACSHSPVVVCAYVRFAGVYNLREMLFRLLTGQHASSLEA